MFLDETLNFGEHLKYIVNKVNTCIGLLRKLTQIFTETIIIYYIQILYKTSS